MESVPTDTMVAGRIRTNHDTGAPQAAHAVDCDAASWIIVTHLFALGKESPYNLLGWHVAVLKRHVHDINAHLLENSFIAKLLRALEVEIQPDDCVDSRSGQVGAEGVILQEIPLAQHGSPDRLPPGRMFIIDLPVMQLSLIRSQ